MRCGIRSWMRHWRQAIGVGGRGLGSHLPNLRGTIARHLSFSSPLHRFHWQVEVPAPWYETSSQTVGGPVNMHFMAKFPNWATAPILQKVRGEIMKQTKEPTYLGMAELFATKTFSQFDLIGRAFATSGPSEIVHPCPAGPALLGPLQPSSSARPLPPRLSTIFVVDRVPLQCFRQLHLTVRSHTAPCSTTHSHRPMQSHTATQGETGPDMPQASSRDSGSR